MRPFTFSVLHLLQKADDALRLERTKARANPLTLAVLAMRRRRLSARLARSLTPSMAEA